MLGLVRLKFLWDIKHFLEHGLLQRLLIGVLVKSDY